MEITDLSRRDLLRAASKSSKPLRLGGPTFVKTDDPGERVRQKMG
jgi:hypothetical protein